MLNKKKYILTLLLLGSLFISFFQEKVEADDTSEIGFYIEQVVPSSQLDYSRNFFYVQTIPGQEQELKVRIINTSGKKKSIEISIDDAVSTETGIIDYKEPLIKEESLKYPISEILTTEKKVIELEADEKKTIIFKLNPPEESYLGVKMGKISFKNKSGEEAGGVIDVYNSYSLDVVTSETSADFRHGMTLNLLDVKPELNNGRKVVQAHLQNPESELIRDLEIKAKLINFKTKETIKEIKVVNYAVAPNSVLPFVFDLGLSNMVAGDYKVEMTAKNEDNTWNMEKEFKITGGQAKKINDESPFRIKTPLWIKGTTIGLGIMGLLTIVGLQVRYSKWLKEFRMKRRRKTTKKGRNKR